MNVGMEWLSREGAEKHHPRRKEGGPCADLRTPTSGVRHLIWVILQMRV